MSTLNNGQTLAQGGTLKSGNGAYTLVLQGDGNLVLYHSLHMVSGNAIWNSGTCGKGNPPFRLVMQSDNNLVLYDGIGTPTWSSGSNGKGDRQHARLVVQDDRNLVVYGPGALWATMTNC